MKHIIVHTGYVPASIVKKAKTLTPEGIPAQLIMLTPEINIVNKTNELLDGLAAHETLEIATNNIIVIYTIRAYIVKHPNDYSVEYRYYTKDDYYSKNEPHYQIVTQSDHGDFENAPDGFFDTIDNLLLQMLELKTPTKKRIAITINDKRILNDVLDEDEKSYFLKDLAKYEAECVLNEDWLNWTDVKAKIQQINFYKSLKTNHDRSVYATAIGQQLALNRVFGSIETLLTIYDLDCVNSFFKNTEFYIKQEDSK